MASGLATTDLDRHRRPSDWGDRLAFGFVKFLRADEVAHRDVNHAYADQLTGRMS